MILWKVLQELMKKKRLRTNLYMDRRRLLQRCVDASKNIKDGGSERPTNGQTQTSRKISQVTGKFDLEVPIQHDDEIVDQCMDTPTNQQENALKKIG